MKSKEKGRINSFATSPPVVIILFNKRSKKECHAVLVQLMLMSLGFGSFQQNHL